MRRRPQTVRQPRLRDWIPPSQRWVQRCCRRRQRAGRKRRSARRATRPTSAATPSLPGRVVTSLPLDVHPPLLVPGIAVHPGASRCQRAPQPAPKPPALRSTRAFALFAALESRASATMRRWGGSVRCRNGTGIASTGPRARSSSVRPMRSSPSVRIAGFRSGIRRPSSCSAGGRPRLSDLSRRSSRRNSEPSTMPCSSELPAAARCPLHLQGRHHGRRADRRQQAAG